MGGAASPLRRGLKQALRLQCDTALFPRRRRLPFAKGIETWIIQHPDVRECE